MIECKIVNIRPLFLFIRLAPVAILAVVHCSSRRWPTNDECLPRALKYGFSFSNFSEKWTCIWTHIFVHFSNEHFLANAFALTCALIDFRGDSLIEFFEGESLWASIQSAIGSFLLMLVAGPVGGIGGQMLYNKIQIERPIRKAVEILNEKIASLCHLLLLPKMKGSSSCTPTSGALGEGYEAVSRAISTSLKGISSFWQSCFFNSTAGIQKIVNRSMVMCGASAAVCGLAGFNAVFFRNPIGMFFMVMPDAVLLLHKLASSACASGWERYTDALRSLMPRQTVGHAAHLGGFMVGASIGWVLRRILRRTPEVLRGPRTSKTMTVYLFTL